MPRGGPTPAPAPPRAPRQGWAAVARASYPIPAAQHGHLYVTALQPSPLTVGARPPAAVCVPPRVALTAAGPLRPSAIVGETAGPRPGPGCTAGRAHGAKAHAATVRNGERGFGAAPARPLRAVPPACSHSVHPGKTPDWQRHCTLHRRAARPSQWADPTPSPSPPTAHSFIRYTLRGHRPAACEGAPDRAPQEPNP
jgi:hypothetical protein